MVLWTMNTYNQRSRKLCHLEKANANCAVLCRMMWKKTPAEKEKEKKTKTIEANTENSNGFHYKYHYTLQTINY